MTLGFRCRHWGSRVRGFANLRAGSRGGFRVHGLGFRVRRRVAWVWAHGWPPLHTGSICQPDAWFPSKVIWLACCLDIRRPFHSRARLQVCPPLPCLSFLIRDLACTPGTRGWGVPGSFFRATEGQKWRLGVFFGAPCHPPAPRLRNKVLGSLGSQGLRVLGSALNPKP